MVQPFHRQSQGFGAYLIDEMNKDENLKKSIYDDGMAYMPDKKKLRKYIPLPEYIKCKIWKEKAIDDDGDEYWIWNEEGKQWKLSRIEKTVKMLTDRYTDIYNNIDKYLTYFNSEDYKYIFGDLYNTDIKSIIDSLMCGRSFEMLSIYASFYQYRLFEKIDLDEIRKGHLDIYDIVYRSLYDKKHDCKYRNYLKEYGYLLDKGIGSDEIDDLVNLFDTSISKNIDLVIGDKYMDCYNLCCSKTVGIFRYFDLVLYYFSLVMRGINKYKDDEYHRKLEIKSRLKKLNKHYTVGA